MKAKLDSIELKAYCHNREVSALGAVIAADGLLGKTGVFTMERGCKP